MKSKVNLHIHTIHSDGGKSVFEVVELLRNAGVESFAITDHDTVEGNVEAEKIALEFGLKHFNGIELSCCFESGEIGLDESWVCHIVGLGIDIEKMREKLKQIENEKDKKLHELFDLLVADGYGIELKNVVISEKIPSRKTISKELINKGYAANSDECYKKILNTDRYRSYAKDKPTIKEGIHIIHDCDGLAIWAHPFGVTRGGKKVLTKEQVKLFFEKIKYEIDGAEVFYHKYDAEQIRFLNMLVDNENKYRVKKILKSVGTDYHSPKLSSETSSENTNLPLREKESIQFNVNEVEPDENIAAVLYSRKYAVKIKYGFNSSYTQTGSVTISPSRLSLSMHSFGELEVESDYIIENEEDIFKFYMEIGCSPFDEKEKIKAAFLAKFDRPIKVKEFFNINNMNYKYDSWGTMGD